jgi:hypothetical protein
MQRVAKLWRSPCQSRYVETLHKSMIIVAVGAWSVIMRKANSLLTKQNIATHSMRLAMSRKVGMTGRLIEGEDGTDEKCVTFYHIEILL